MPSKFLSRLSAVVIVLAVVLGVTARILGDRLNRDQILGCLVVGAFLFIVSLAFFLRGSVPYRPLIASDAHIRWGFRFSTVCVAYALFQIPVWCLLTRCFPPDGFTDSQAVVVTAGVVISMFGSATPWIILFIRFLRARNEQQRALLKQRKNKNEKL